MHAARGIVRHRFWGEYSAVVGLVWGGDEATEQDYRAADLALAKLGEPFRHGKDRRTLVAVVTTEGLTELEERLRRIGDLKIQPCGARHCHRQCADASIGGVPHSIDYGPSWTWWADLVEARGEQLPLL